MTPPRELVFVYGTLRRGGSNHFRMDGAEFITAGRICGRMYKIDWYPGLVLDEAGDDIVGEVYSVDLEMLGNLDSFENVSAGDVEDSEYRRVETTVAREDGETLTAWIWEWLGEVDESQRIHHGDWLA
ncbi:MAG: gamma-glutamylcyclotransferase family protein [Luteolibacter sp.]